MGKTMAAGTARTEAWSVILVSDDLGLADSLHALLARAPEASLSVTGTADALVSLRKLVCDAVLLDADSLTDVARMAGAAVLIQPAPVAVIGLAVTPGSQGYDLCRSRGASLIHAKVSGMADPLLAGPAGDNLLAGLRALISQDANLPPQQEATNAGH
ncbi:MULTISPECIES: hypothetical protein [unclassified Pannonibacter]|uniref:hypothetical protein n=1 Tax=unclassified Pannonibacter TaxID=2627228 RepID=UPI0016466E74|nr:MULTISPECIES: hypothetical protein [unclassified Pannonibacter]